jgi:hypothetical protein
MAVRSICAVPDCGKLTIRRDQYCSMHRARLRRGGSLEPRQPRKSLAELLESKARFGHWTVLGEGEPYQRPLRHGKRSPHGRQRRARCRCVCGVERDIGVQTLKSGQSRHCGCMVPELTIAKNTTHGLSGSPEYRSWCHLKERCTNPACKDWPDYGGRGIRVCAEWQNDFAAFYTHVGPKPSPSHSIDRIDVNGNYEPGNVRWADPTTQRNNRRT